MSDGNGTMTEAERERADRARVDRLNEIKKAYEEKHNRSMSRSDLSKSLDGLDLAGAEAREPERKPRLLSPSLSERDKAILAAVEEHANEDGVYWVEPVLAELGWPDDYNSRGRLTQAMSNMRTVEKSAARFRAHRGRKLRSPSAKRPVASPVPPREEESLPPSEVRPFMARLAAVDRALDAFGPEELGEVLVYLKARYE